MKGKLSSILTMFVLGELAEVKDVFSTPIKGNARKVIISRTNSFKYNKMNSLPKCITYTGWSALVKIIYSDSDYSD